jgi:Holliday junction DNA helicase RuvA
VGYEVLIPFSTDYELGEGGDTVSLRSYTHVKEDAFSLYGFLTSNEKRLFTQLIQISGIGPKLGVTILSGLPVGECRGGDRRERGQAE